MSWQPPPSYAPPPPPPPVPPPPRRRFPWATFWTAIGALATAAGIFTAVAVDARQDASSGAAERGTSPISASAVATATPSASPSASGLAVRVAPVVMHSCTPADMEEVDGVREAVTCTPTTTGPSDGPLVVQYTDHDAMARAMRDEAAAAGTSTAEQCGELALTYVGTWKDAEGEVRGDLVCRYVDTAYRIVWTFDDDDIALVISGETLTTYQWWYANAAHVLRQRV